MTRSYRIKQLAFIINYKQILSKRFNCSERNWHKKQRLWMSKKRYWLVFQWSHRQPVQPWPVASLSVASSACWPCPPVRLHRSPLYLHRQIYVQIYKYTRNIRVIFNLLKLSSRVVAPITFVHVPREANTRAKSNLRIIENSSLIFGPWLIVLYLKSNL